MIIREELSASLDEPTGCLIMHRVEPSRLQLLGLAFTDKVSQLADNNEQVSKHLLTFFIPYFIHESRWSILAVAVVLDMLDLVEHGTRSDKVGLAMKRADVFNFKYILLKVFRLILFCVQNDRRTGLDGLIIKRQPWGSSGASTINRRRDNRDNKARYWKNSIHQNLLFFTFFPLFSCCCLFQEKCL